MTLTIIQNTDHDTIDLLLLAGYTFHIWHNIQFFSEPDLSPPICDGCGYRFAIGAGEAPEDSGLCYECDQADHSCEHCGGSGELSTDTTLYSAYTQEPEYDNEQCDHCEGQG